MSKIQKTIERQQEKISEGQYYEAHQQLRVIASRYIKQSKWDEALTVLESGALALLQAEQGGSGGDLCLYFVDTLNKAERTPTSLEKGKFFRLLRAFPNGEPTRRKFINEAIAWSVKYGEYENGDPEMHHVVGSLYAEGKAFIAYQRSKLMLLDHEPYDAERHLALGTRDSPESLALLEYSWYRQDDSHTAPLYAARAILPYLLLRNLRSANKAYLIFSSRLSENNTVLGVQDVSSVAADLRVHPSLPLLNFLGLLLLTVQRGSADLFRLLTKHYAAHIKEVPIWDEALAYIGEMYFGIRIPKQGNPLFDMMGNMLFGGGAGGGSGGSRAANTRGERAASSITAPPPAELD